jgi:hypothetical protein
MTVILVVDAIIKVARIEIENPTSNDLLTPKLSLIKDVNKPQNVIEAPHIP